jgi:hypothetical protein
MGRVDAAISSSGPGGGFDWWRNDILLGSTSEAKPAEFSAPLNEDWNEPVEANGEALSLVDRNEPRHFARAVCSPAGIGLHEPKGVSSLTTHNCGRLLVRMLP